MTIFEKDYTITYSDCDFLAKMSITRLFELHEDCFSSLMDKMKLNNHILEKEYHSAWVFVKTRFDVLSSPLWNQTVHLRSRVISSNKLTCFVLTEILYEDKILISVLSQACVIDKVNYRLVRLSSLPFEAADEEYDFSFDFENVDYQKEESFMVESSMIDYSMHLNNTKAISPFMDRLSLEEYRHLTSTSFQILMHYINQGKYKQSLQLLSYKEEDFISFFLKDTDKDILLFNLKKN